MQATVPLACFLSLIRPPGIQFENALLQIAPVDKAKCPFVRDNIDVNFMLYTRHNPTVPHKLTIDDDESLFSSSIDFNDPTMIYFHAFMETADDGSALWVREAFTYRGDTNVIVVDAQRLEAGPWYFTAAENTWYIGRIGAQFIDFMVSRGLKLSKTHLVGHSLGAQIAGVAGATLQSGRVSRITGLDPALPLFNKLPLIQRLDPSDAEFVDAIHTDAGIFGFDENVGHADFYPNGGISPQPGCELEVVIPKQELLRKCNTQPKGYFIYYLQAHKQPDKHKASLSKITNIITIARTLNNIRSAVNTLRNINKENSKKSFKFLKHSIPKINKIVQPIIKNQMNKPNHRQRRLISFLKPRYDKGTKELKNNSSFISKIDKVIQIIFKNRTNKLNHRQRRFIFVKPDLLYPSIKSKTDQDTSTDYKTNKIDTIFDDRTENSIHRQFAIQLYKETGTEPKLEDVKEKIKHRQFVKARVDQQNATESKLENVTIKINHRQLVKPQLQQDTALTLKTEEIDPTFENGTEKPDHRQFTKPQTEQDNTDPKIDKTDATFENRTEKPHHKQFIKPQTKKDNIDSKIDKTDATFENGTENPNQRQLDEMLAIFKNRTQTPNHRKRRFISFLKPQSEGSLMNILHFVMRHHKKVIPVITVIREINTLITTSNGEFNNYIKEQNHYIGTSPSTQTVNYNFDINNDSRVMSILKKLFGFGQGNKVSVTTS